MKVENRLAWDLVAEPFGSEEDVGTAIVNVRDGWGRRRSAAR